MKLKFLSLALISVAAGCTTNVEDYSYYLDAVHRATDPVSYSGGPFDNMVNGRILMMVGNELAGVLVGLPIDSLEHGQNFDAAVGLFRGQNTNGLSDPNQISVGRVAFESHNTPAQVGSVSLNNDALAWLPSGSTTGLDYSYGTADPNLFGSQNSMAFSYVDFNGETLKDSVPVAPAFGTITFPDTISVSHGCTISYQHPVANDSIGIYVTVYGTDSGFFVTRPDTGSIIFAPNQLPVDPYLTVFDSVTGTWPNYGFYIYFFRSNWSTQITPSGKKIAVYSSMETDGQYIPAKP